METISLEQGLAIKRISHDTFENIEEPFSWFGKGKVVPGGVLMGLAAAAAYETVPNGFAIDTLQAHFLSGPRPSGPRMQLVVGRLSDGKRFAARTVRVEQTGKLAVFVTCTFVQPDLMTGPSLEHSVKRSSIQTVEEITLDDLAPGRTRQGPYMQFERLPLEYIASSSADRAHPSSTLEQSAARISPPIKTSTRRSQSLGIIVLSDFHVMDCAPVVHGMNMGLQPIGANPRLPDAKSDFDVSTSLNHFINFRLHDGFRADDLCYIEVLSPWAKTRRANMQSKIFTRHGVLIAVCMQEAYYVLRPDNSKGKL